MIKKILIANRGEIVSRIIRTCNQLKIKTVTIFSEADRLAKYTGESNESYFIGPSPVGDSYLNSDKIIEIALKANVDAIHPGYGFLSEDSDFAKKCSENNIIFIGPSYDLIRKMGNKTTSRELMKKVGVPIIPGSDGPVSSVEEALKVTQDLEYPIMLKASAGGGGVGMQIIYSDRELISAFNNNS